MTLAASVSSSSYPKFIWLSCSFVFACCVHIAHIAHIAVTCSRPLVHACMHTCTLSPLPIEHGCWVWQAALYSDPYLTFMHVHAANCPASPAHACRPERPVSMCMRITDTLLHARPQLQVLTSLRSTAFVHEVYSISSLPPRIRAHAHSVRDIIRLSNEQARYGCCCSACHMSALPVHRSLQAF